MQAHGTEDRSLAEGDARHAFLAYDGEEIFRARTVAFLGAGIEADERLGFFAPASKLPELTIWLSAAGHDLGRLAHRGQLIVGDVRGNYLGSGEGGFDIDRQISTYERMVAESLEDGFRGLRVVGDVGSLMDHPNVRDSWAAYELRADLLTTRLPMVAMCSFDTRICDTEMATCAQAVHAHDLGPRPEPPSFRVVASAGGGIQLEGDIDIANAELVAQMLVEAAPSAAGSLDISGVTFTDVAGIRAIAQGALALLDSGSPVVIRGASTTFGRLWSLMGLHRYETIRVESIHGHLLRF